MWSSTKSSLHGAGCLLMFPGSESDFNWCTVFLLLPSCWLAMANCNISDLNLKSALRASSGEWVYRWSRSSADVRCWRCCQWRRVEYGQPWMGSRILVFLGSTSASWNDRSPSLRYDKTGLDGECLVEYACLLESSQVLWRLENLSATISSSGCHQGSVGGVCNGLQSSQERCVCWRCGTTGFSTSLQAYLGHLQLVWSTTKHGYRWRESKVWCHWVVSLAWWLGSSS